MAGEIAEDRVSRHTRVDDNMRIAHMIECSIAYYAAHPEEIDDRLEELDREWDIERSLEANAATVSLVSTAISLVFRRRLTFFPMIVAGFLLQHAVKGWCPPLPVFRRMGIRTKDEINYERFALKYLRGDFEEFDAIAGSNNIRSINTL